MADISKELAAILTAEYGEEVRGSIHDGIKAVNESAEGSAAAAEKAMEEAVISASIAAYQVVLAQEAGEEAAISASIAAYRVILAESWAQGGTGVREDEDKNSSKAWCEKSEEYAKGWRGSLLPQGTIEFSELPTEDMEKGHLYNISNAFVTDERFEEGAGYSYPAGTNVYWNKNEHWDCLSGTLTKILTQAEYDSLPEEEKLNGTIYYITDGDNEIPDATDTEKGLVIVDKELSEESKNPVQNKVIAEALKNLDGVKGTEISQAEYDALTEEEKMNGKVYYIYDAEAKIPDATDKEKGLVIVDKELSEESENPIQNKAVAEALKNLDGEKEAYEIPEGEFDPDILTEYEKYKGSSQSFKANAPSGISGTVFLILLENEFYDNGFIRQTVSFCNGLSDTNVSNNYRYMRIIKKKEDGTVSHIQNWLRAPYSLSHNATGRIVEYTASNNMQSAGITTDQLKNLLASVPSGVFWTNSSNGTYKFVKKGFQWISDNKGVQSSTAQSTWTCSLTAQTNFTLKYKVSSEAGYDKLTVTLDGTMIVNAVSGDGSEQTYSKMLSAGSHTLVAKFTKDGSSDKYDDCAYLIL